MTKEFLNKCFYITNIIICLVVVPSMVSRPKSQSKMLNMSAHLTCLAHGYPLPLVRWRKNGEVLTEDKPYKVSRNSTTETSVISTLNISEVSRDDNGTFVCEVSNALAKFENKLNLIVLGKLFQAYSLV